MHKIAENGIVTLTAGDSLFLPLYIEYVDKDGNRGQYILTGDDKIYFSLMEPRQPFEAGIVRKICDASDLDNSGKVVIELDALDTDRLHPGLYYYEIKFAITYLDKEYIDTIVPKRKFFIV